MRTLPDPSGRGGVPAPRQGDETVLRQPDTPLYIALVQRWQALGRTAPGQPDPEWDTLTRRGRHRA